MTRDDHWPRAEENYPVIQEGPWKGWRDVGYTTDGPDFQVKSSGQKVFPSGAMRDSATDKPRYDLIDPGFLYRFAEHMRKGAEHYGEHNWTKGIPSSNYMQSLLRHVEAYRRGERDEDHLAAAAFNLMGLMRNEGTELHDLYDWGQP